MDEATYPVHTGINPHGDQPRVLISMHSTTGIPHQFFERSSEHPRILHWRKIRNTYGADPSVELFREFHGLTYGHAVLRVTFPQTSNQQSIQEQEPWDADLDMALVDEGWRATSTDNESRRMALHLKRIYSSTESRFGGTYFNSVLVQYVAESIFSQDPRIAALLKYISSNQPDKACPLFQDCHGLVEAGLTKIAQKLTRALHYERADAEGILSATLAHYLDERFSISAMRSLSAEGT